MSDVNCAFLSDLGEGVADGAADEHCTRFRVQAPLKEVRAVRAKPSGNEAICPWEQNEPL